MKHYKISDIVNNKDYYISIKESFDLTVLEQVLNFLNMNKLLYKNIRVLETSNRVINLSLKEFILQKKYL